VISEFAQVSDHLRDASLRTLTGNLWPAFLVVDALVEDLPDQATQPMGNGPR
jgi:hypothetical protein